MPIYATRPDLGPRIHSLRPQSRPLVRGTAQGTGIAGLRASCPSPGGAAGRSVFPVRIPQQAWERVNTLPASRVNDVHGGTVPLRSESDLLAGGLDLCIIEAAGCAAGPGGQRFPDCSQPPAAGGGGHRPARRYCPGDMPRRRHRPPSKQAGPSLPVMCPGRPSNQPKR